MLISFQYLFTLAMILDLCKWDYTISAAASWLFLLTQMFGKKKTMSFFFFLVFITSHLLWRFPVLPNHMNIALFVSLFLLPTYFRAMICEDDQVDEIVKATFQKGFQTLFCWTIILVYFFAGFHKLNADFFDPISGCTTSILSRLPDSYGLSFEYPAWFLGIAPYLTLACELGGAIFLLFRRTQFVGFIFVLAMHAYLSAVRFHDFSATAMAFLICFIPFQDWAARDSQASEQGVLGPSSSVRAFVLFNAIFVPLILALQAYPFENVTTPPHKTLQGFLHLAGVLLLIAFAIRMKKTGAWPRFQSSIWTPIFPRYLWALPAFLVIYAFSPYFGLRTAGTFTMFSNLRTEGADSNHLILGSNPLKFASFQEDIVFIRSIDPRVQRWRRSMPRNGMRLPVLEFERLMTEWREAGLPPLSAEIKYRQRWTETDDLLNDPDWQVDSFSWPRKLFLFREVQAPDQPTRCRW